MAVLRAVYAHTAFTRFFDMLSVPISFSLGAAPPVADFASLFWSPTLPRLPPLQSLLPLSGHQLCYYSHPVANSATLFRQYIYAPSPRH